MHPWTPVEKFEKSIADYFGSPYAVSIDCCTHAIELCLRYKNIQETSCPSHTYISIPFTFIKLGIKWSFVDINWQDFYQLGDSNIIDAAVLWRENSYITGSLMCLSFQNRKHLSLGKGGMILLDNAEDYNQLLKLRYDGRDPYQPWIEQNIKSVGYHYYMTPEIASIGLEKLEKAKKQSPIIWNQDSYPYLPEMDVFKNLNIVHKVGC